MIIANPTFPEVVYAGPHPEGGAAVLIGATMLGLGVVSGVDERKSPSGSTV